MSKRAAVGRLAGDDRAADKAEAAVIEVVAVEIVRVCPSAPDAMNGLKFLSSKKSWTDE